MIGAWMDLEVKANSAYTSRSIQGPRRCPWNPLPWTRWMVYSRQPEHVQGLEQDKGFLDMDPWKAYIILVSSMYSCY